MRRSRNITIVIVLLCLLAVLAGGTILCRHYLPTPGPTYALFERYKSNPHIDASLLRDFRIEDTLTVDVITLQADSDSAWCALMADFGMPEEFIELYRENKDFFMANERNSIVMISIDKKNPNKRLPKSDPNSRLVIGSFSKRTLCIFMTEGLAKKILIEKTEIKKLKK